MAQRIVWFFLGALTASIFWLFVINTGGWSIIEGLIIGR